MQRCFGSPLANSGSGKHYPRPGLDTEEPELLLPDDELPLLLLPDEEGV